MAVKRYKIGFRAEYDGSLSTLWDSGEMVPAYDYDFLKSLLIEAMNQIGVESKLYKRCEAVIGSQSTSCAVAEPK